MISIFGASKAEAQHLDPGGFARTWDYEGTPSTAPDIQAAPPRRARHARLPFTLRADADALLTAGLPKGATLSLDGRPLHTAARDERLPDAWRTALTLPAGDHLLTVTLPPAPTSPRFDGWGFFVRLLQPDGLHPLPDLTVRLPSTAPLPDRWTTTTPPHTPPPPGIQRLTYPSPLSPEPQPFAALLPERPDPRGRPHPLVVALHGHRGDPARTCAAALGGLSPAAWQRLSDPAPLLLCPWGFGDTAFRYAGEDDLFRAIEALHARVPIDPDRVHLLGISDGGLAALELGLHHPDRWASVTALAAVGDMRAFPSIGPGPHDPDTEAWLDRSSPLTWAPNARGMTWRLAFGLRDRLPAAEPQRMADALRAAGADVTLRLHPDLGHNVWDRELARGDLLTSLLPLRRTPPHPLTFRSLTPRYRQSWGLTLLHADWTRAPTLTLRHPDPNTLDLTASPAVHAFSLPAPATLRDLRLNDATLPLPPGPPAPRLLLTRTPEGWRADWDPTQGPPLPWPPPEGHRGYHARTGPLDELRAGPTLAIYPAAPHLRPLGAWLAHLDNARWTRGVTLPSRALAADDLALTPALLNTHNLLLIGSPNDNPWIDRLTPDARAALLRLPHDHALRARFDHPGHPALHVVVATARTTAGATPALYLPEILADRAAVAPSDVLPPFGMVPQRSLTPP